MLNPNQRLDTECATVIYLLDKDGFYLSQKKKDIHKDSGETLSKSSKWNGYGGKWEEGDESIIHTAIRELIEESSVLVRRENLIPVGRVEFFWPGNTTGKRDMEVFFFLAREYVGFPSESETMGIPKLFTVDDAPYNEMMPADELIIRNIMNRKTINGSVYFTKVNGKTVIHKPILMIQEQ